MKQEGILIAAEENAVVGVKIPFVGQVKSYSLVLALHRFTIVRTVVKSRSGQAGWWYRERYR